MPQRKSKISIQSSKQSREFILKKAQDNNVRFIRLWFCDILGQLKSFAITIDELMEVMEEGAGFDGSAIEGFARYIESDMRAFPDPATFEILPWRPRENAVARMFADIKDMNGAPFVG